MIVGAEAGFVHGVKPIDSAKLDDGVARYVGGSSGPSWEPDYVTVDGAEVLVITIDPPSPGDPIWPLRKGFTDPAGKTHHDGRIFIRRNGLTSAQPTAAELDMLQRRARAGQVGLDLDVVLVSEAAICPLDLGEATKGRWLDRERTRLLEGVPVEQQPRPMITPPFAEQRSPREYREEVEDYLELLADVFPLAFAVDAVSAGFSRVDLRVDNNSEHNFHRLLVEVYFEGSVKAFFDADEAGDGWDRPSPPRKFGTTRLPTPILDIPTPQRLRSGSIDNSASARVRFQEFDLRPGYQHPLDPLYVVVDPDLAGKEIAASWTATSTSVSGSAQGQLVIPVDDRQLTIVEPSGSQEED